MAAEFPGLIALLHITDPYMKIALEAVVEVGVAAAIVGLLGLVGLRSKD